MFEGVFEGVLLGVLDGVALLDGVLLADSVKHKVSAACTAPLAFTPKK